MKDSRHLAGAMTIGPILPAVVPGTSPGLSPAANTRSAGSARRDAPSPSCVRPPTLASQRSWTRGFYWPSTRHQLLLVLAKRHLR